MHVNIGQTFKMVLINIDILPCFSHGWALKWALRGKQFTQLTPTGTQRVNHKLLTNYMHYHVIPATVMHCYAMPATLITRITKAVNEQGA